MRKTESHLPAYLSSLPITWAGCPERPLARVPHRRREPGLASRDGVGPNYDLFAVLPLAGHELMSDLVPALIHREVAGDSLRFEREQRFPQLFGIETTSPP